MTHPAPTHLLRAPAALLAATLVLAACGSATDDATDTAAPAASTDTDAASAPASDFPVTLPDGTVLEERPERIVSLSPSATEILFAIGAGDQVVAADEFSTYPAEAPTTDLSGFDPNVEAILGYEPDLVVIANDIDDLKASLEALDVPVLVNAAPADIESGYAGLADLALATGHVDEGAAVVEQMRADVAAALEKAPRGAGLRVYHELDETLYAASSASFIGSVYTELGAVNIADEADTEQTGYPQLTEEAVVDANPQLVVISDAAIYTVDDVAARPGWAEVDAVRTGSIVAVDADISSRWGPRLPELIDTLAEAMSAVPVAAGSR
ncbi:ABC transporter substrate-binding protein [Ornithinimicrobium humiphilum]|uniref:Iron complex transport system substrate-binding protein n=1 Tax=Ornithinimicrobium humiphilum TaxID=125288 RepID=A0A543K6V0_9MICO|nr:ABC transporter substrate-binding protein [Ornithinimicrobium humiphilum]TQM90809.1 iron complex transport system substrate-binding protein [Ornithinimicrobium humiphilum]